MRKVFRPRLEMFESRSMLSVNVLAYHNGGTQTGLNPDETILKPSTVNSAEFGKVFSVNLDGQAYAQPLYVSGLSIPGQGTHNVVFVATEHDSVYAFDGDNGSLLWHDSLINPAAGITSVPSGEIPDAPAHPEVGISSTPTIDTSTNTVYVVTFTKEVSGSTTSYVYRLHALDATTGAEKFGGPVKIQAEDNGTGVGNDGNGHVIFNATQEDQRVGLLLLNGVVYFGFASSGDVEPYHGWLLGYNAKTLQQAAVFDDTPNGSEGGIWMSTASPATDGTYIYLATGNGTFDTTMDASGFPTQGDYGDSYVKLAVDPSSSLSNQNKTGWGLKVVDYFTPYNQASLSAQDLDIGSTGLTVLPDQSGPYPHELVGTSKDGVIYVVNRDNMGKFNSSSNKIIQEIDNQFPGGGFSSPAYFNGQVYIAGQSTSIKAFQVTNGLLTTSPTSQSGNIFPNHGATPSVSANGTSNGIVWAQENNSTSQPAVLYAFNASNLADELFNSSQVPGRDQAGLALNFVSPTIANGKVYVATAGELDVYGLLPPIADEGFEQPAVGAGKFEYDPTGSAWTYSGTSGISGNNSSFTAGNPPAPQGVQVAFIQQTGSISQTVTVLAAGAYVLTFDAAQRRTGEISHQNLNVLIDGNFVSSVTPSGTSYQGYTTAPFTVTAGMHTIEFQGLNSAGGDNTSFLDQIGLSIVGLPTIGNPGFEQVVVGGGTFKYDPTGSAWTFSGPAGISGNGSAFTGSNPPAPQGVQVAFLQEASSITQSVAGWSAGTYVLTFDAAQRANMASHQNFNVLIDGNVMSTFTPSSTSYQSYSTAPFTVGAGNHTIAFQGLNSTGGDNTVFLDQVALTSDVIPSIGDPDFEQVVVGAGAFRYDPTGSAWAFSGTAGISGNGSPFTINNPPAPQGDQVAFLQETGSISQVVGGWAAGTYVLTFDAAQRANLGAHQNFNVLIDGKVVSTFTPSSASYQSYSTVAFTVTAGTHTITFQGLNSAGGDNTAFLDRITVAAQS
jgi:hypothetical protein